MEVQSLWHNVFVYSSQSLQCLLNGFSIVSLFTGCIDPPKLLPPRTFFAVWSRELHHATRPLLNRIPSVFNTGAGTGQGTWQNSVTLRGCSLANLQARSKTYQGAQHGLIFLHLFSLQHLRCCNPSLNAMVAASGWPPGFTSLLPAKCRGCSKSLAGRLVDLSPTKHEFLVASSDGDGNDGNCFSDLF